MDNHLPQSPPQNPFAASGLFMNTAAIWSPFKASFEGFAGGGKTFTMCCDAVGIWQAEGGKGNIVLIDTERSSKFIVPFLRQFGIEEGKNLFVTYSRDLQRWGQILALCEQNRGTIMLTDTVTHIYEQMLVQFEKDNGRKVKYPQDALVIKPMWKEKFANPFVNAHNTHLLFTGRAAWEYTMQVDEDTGKKEFNATGVKMRGDNELAYEPDVVVLMERLQKIDDGDVRVARGATILKDRSRLIDGQMFVFKTHDDEGTKLTDKQLQTQVWTTFEPVYRMLSSGNKTVEQVTESDKAMGPLFVKGAGEAYYQSKLRAERTVEEIAGVYNQWGLGGSGGTEKSVRAILNLLVFNTRSTAGLVELHPDVLSHGIEIIDYLSRYAAANMDLVEKSFKASQFDKITDFFKEAKQKYEDELKAKENAPVSPLIQQAPSDDDIPEFTSKAAPTPTPKVEAGKPANLGISEEDKRIIEETTTRDIEESIMAAKTPTETDKKFAEYGAVIAGLSEKNRKRVQRAHTTRKRQLTRGPLAQQPEAGA